MIGTAVRRAAACIAAALMLAAACAAQAATLEAIEFYDATLDHYFVTASSDEIAKLDAGVFAGWQRTGQGFTVYDPATPVAGASPVCRFYGSPAAGLDSHFYSASPAECDAVRQRFPGVWIEESANAFGIGLPNTLTGECPAATIPVYRAWNHRVDSNHRFTTDAMTMQTMLDRGYVAEGYGPGPLPVAMCAPAAGSGGGAVPACTLTASNRSPFVGSTITLSAACTNAPTSFTWTSCAGSGATCSATSASVGHIVYSVVARNAAGPSAPASVDVGWQPVPAAPKCALVRTSQTDPPTVNGFVVLEAQCDATVGSYSWSGCTSTGSICTVRESAPGVHAYSVIGRNAGGSSPPAPLSLNWVASAPSPPGLCGSFPSYLFSDIASQTGRVESTYMPVPPGFAWNGAWAVRFVVPSTMDPAKLGRFSAAEFGGQPTVREATISRTPCDFRATDPSGTSGPYARASGISTTNWFTIDPARAGFPLLSRGGTYYYNVRNYQPANNTISCSPSAGRCDAYVDSVLPR
jgi:hypothetical protein